MADNERILEKVKALLALAGNNPSEHEAAAAAAKAAELMAKYNIRRVELFQHKPAEQARFERRYHEASQQRFWTRILSGVVARAYSCETTYTPGRKQVAFYGRPDNLEVAIYVYTFLERAVLRACDDGWYRMDTWKRRDYSPQTWRRNFCHGAVDAISVKLDAQKAATMKDVPASTMALVKAEDAALSRFIWPSGEPKGVSIRYGGSGYGAGVAAGKNIDVNPGLKSGTYSGPRRLGGG